MRKKGIEQKNNIEIKKKRIMVLHSDGKNWNENDYYPMPNWSVEDQQLWKKIMLEKKKFDS